MKKFLKHFSLFVILLFVLYGCSFTSSCENDSSCTKVLFIGNSYTYVNDLPNMFAKLAKSGGHKVEVGMAAPGGWTLTNHLQSPETLNALSSQKWTYVVLQEQSVMPSLEQDRTQQMYPAARGLVSKIREVGATPLFFLTWAHRAGLPEIGVDYESMQAQLNTGYYAIAQELNVPVVPVGGAWFTALTRHPELSLWQEDGSHPNEQGTYLAACIFYAVVFEESPEGLIYRANLPTEVTDVLQAIASDAVPNTP